MSNFLMQLPAALLCRRRIIEITVIFFLFSSLVGCSSSSTLNWEESVLLPDGRILVLRRKQHFDKNDYLSAHSFEFQHPTTNKTVTWQSDGFFSLVAIFLIGDVPHILLRPTFSVDTERAGCPYPVVLIYKLDDANWQQIPYAASPLREIHNNTTLDPKVDRGYIKASSFRLRPGEIRVRNPSVDEQYYGLNLNKFPVQVFQCPNQKRIELR
jgi:hypothetical protein